MSKCPKCKNMSFSMSDFKGSFDEEKRIISIEECIEYYCDECFNTAYKSVLYKPTEDCVSLNCKKCNSDDKAYIVFTNTPILEKVNDGKVGDNVEVEIELRCKCSIFRPKTLINAQFVIDEINFMEKMPECLK